MQIGRMISQTVVRILLNPYFIIYYVKKRIVNIIDYNLSYSKLSSDEVDDLDESNRHASQWRRR